MNRPFVLVAGTVFLALGQLAFAGNSESAEARVVGGPPIPTQYLFEVEFTAIDGENIVPREMLTLEPGTYTLTARIPARYTEAAVAQRRRKWSEYVDFELTLEPGRDYSVQGKWDRGNLQNPYELVLDEIR